MTKLTNDINGSIIIIDPLSGKNASKSAFRINEIKSTFKEVYMYLNNKKKNYSDDNFEVVNIIYELLNLNSI